MQLHIAIQEFILLKKNYMGFACLSRKINFTGNFIVKKNSIINSSYRIKNHFDYRTVDLVTTTSSRINFIRGNL